LIFKLIKNLVKRQFVNTNIINIDYDVYGRLFNLSSKLGFR